MFAGKVSVIIRTKNEERWIAGCLRRIMEQTVRDVEVVLVDNRSADDTVRRARAILPGIKLVTIDSYLPGLALNRGIAASIGDIVVCLSAHCIPLHQDWLARLLDNLADASVAGVYGRQISTAATPPPDRRDLRLTFGLDRRVQIRDFFFHNANSAIPRRIWERFPFDETLTNIEDQAWGKQVIAAGYTLVYEPEAAVYHSHGIHHHQDSVRQKNVVRIMDNLHVEEEDNGDEGMPVAPKDMDICAMIPVTSPPGQDESFLPLLDRTLQAAAASACISRTIILTDSPVLRDAAVACGAQAPFARPASLAGESVRADQVLAHALKLLSDQGNFPDLVVPMEITFPFRPAGLIDSLVTMLLRNGFDSVLAGIAEYRPVWVEEEACFRRMDAFQTPRAQRRPLLVGLQSLGCVTYPDILRRGSRIGLRVGILTVTDPLAAIEIRNPDDLARWQAVSGSHP